MNKEKIYDFKQRLLTVHQPDLRDFERKASENEFFCEEGLLIEISPAADQVVTTAAQDLKEYLKISMGIHAEIYSGFLDASAEIKRISLSVTNICCKENGFVIETDAHRISVFGDSPRGTAQGVYYLEDIMTLNRAPAVSLGSIRREPMFYPKMVQSGFGYNLYPNEYLSIIAHEGRDTVITYVKEESEEPAGYERVNDLIWRAARYGLDVYAYSELKSDVSPEAENAEEFYENSYGKLFRKCPELKGIILVGESVEFPSRDPHVAAGKRSESAIHGIPAAKPSSGWYPCEDYPVWLNLLKRVIRRHNHDADIVFWTYNWGYQPEEARIKLIEHLPTDISLMVTFEMFEKKQLNKLFGNCSDYTLSFEGPGSYFISEAKAAKKRGIRLYGMTNTGGLTWDFGVIPYEPMPHQWIKRYKAMRMAHREWGLSGLVETHEYGIYPSFISKLSKWSFYESKDMDESILEKILGAWYGQSNADKVNRGLQYFSEAIQYYVPSVADQYGAFRVGPSYPFCLDRYIGIYTEQNSYVNSICYTKYADWVQPAITPLSMRIHEEIESLERMQQLLEQGLQCLEDIETKNDELERLINLGTFMKNTVATGIHAKKWYVLVSLLRVETDRSKYEKILADMEELIHNEMENVEHTIPMVEVDSRLGWCPTMDYVCDTWHLRWKQRELHYLLEHEIKNYRKCLDNIRM